MPPRHTYNADCKDSIGSNTKDDSVVVQLTVCHIQIPATSSMMIIAEEQTKEMSSYEPQKS